MTKNDQFPQFELYSAAGLCRSSGRRGGIAIYLKLLHHRRVFQSQLKCRASHCSRKRFVVAVAYRPPDGSKPLFLAFLDDLVCFLNRLSRAIFSYGF